MPENRILLLAMPWNRPDYPSIQVGRLKSFLSGQGFECHASYPFLHLAKAIGEETYVYLCETVNEILLEGIFCSTFQENSNDALVHELAAVTGLTLATVRQIVTVCSDSLEWEYCRHDWDCYSHVGFTCTFAQTWASLALSRVVKERHPQVKIVFGGSALNEEVARHIEKQFPFVDFVVTGPGESALLELLNDPTASRGHRIGGGLLRQHLTVVPDYAEYFAQLQESGVQVTPAVILATSAGCDYNRCGFCALNNADGYLTLSAMQIGEMISRCVEKHAVSRIEFADTSLVTIHSDDPLSEQLAALGIEFYGELRAVLSDEKARRLKRAGFSGVQLGIESFITPVLTAMIKPADLVQNLYNLKLCLEHELEVAYNLILDYPGTTDDHLLQMLELLPLIVHLPPPTSLCRFLLYRNAPAFRQPEKHGILACRPSRLYVLGLGERYGRCWPAVQFDYTPYTSPSVETLGRLDSACTLWAEAYDPKRALLSVEAFPDHAVVTDRRFSMSNVYEIDGEVAHCLCYCEEPRQVNDLNRAYDHLVINELLDKRLLIIDNHRVLSLPVRSRARNMAYRERPNSDFAYNFIQ